MPVTTVVPLVYQERICEKAHFPLFSTGVATQRQVHHKKKMVLILKMPRVFSPGTFFYLKFFYKSEYIIGFG
jgi:hypothetical protein